MAVRDFAIELIEELLKDNELALTEENIRFYDKGTTAETDENLDDHIRWRNARYYNEDSNVVRSSLLIVQLPVGQSAEYINFHVGELYRIYRRVGDMALVLYISLGNIDQGSINNILSAMVPRDTFQEWGLNENDVFDRTLANTMRLQPPVFCNITSGLGGQFQQKHVPFMDDESVTFNFDNPMAPALTTEQEINGAIAAFYPGVLERLHQMVDGDFYLVFTGISDVHIHPVNGRFKVSSMRKSLADMNRDMNKRGELLSRQIYRYSGETKDILAV